MNNKMLNAASEFFYNAEECENEEIAKNLYKKAATLISKAYTESQDTEKIFGFTIDFSVDKKLTFKFDVPIDRKWWDNNIYYFIGFAESELITEKED